MAMERRGGIDPPLKRQRLETTYHKLNTEEVQSFKPTTEMLVADLAEELDLTRATVLHKNVKLSPSDKIPVTSPDHPLHFITEVVLHVKVNGDPVKRLRKKLMITPSYTLGDAMIDDCLDFETFVVFFKDKIVHPDTLIRTLLGKTTPINHLRVVSKIIVKVQIKYQKSETTDVEIEATSPVQKLVDELRSRLNTFKTKWKLENKNVLLKHDDSEVEDWSQPVVNFSLHLPFFFGFKPLSEEDKLNCAKLMAPASTYAGPPTTSRCATSECNKVLDFCKTPLYNHREGKVGNDVALYYPPFQHFMDDCKNIIATLSDCNFAMALCNAMCKYYHKEEDRKNALFLVLQEYLPYGCTKNIPGESKCDIAIDGKLYAEVKNEVGAKGAESFSEVISYWANGISTNFSKHCPVPAFLLEVIGPHLIISGAVYCNAFCVDRLAPPLWLVPQTQNQEAMTDIVRVLAALKKGIQSLHDYYSQLPATNINHGFPAYDSFESETGEKNIKYEREMQRHLFQGTVDGEKVVVKFCEEYSEEAHHLLESIGCAPRLYCCVDVSRRFKMVVMEFVEGADLGSYLRNETDCEEKQKILDQCEEVLNTLHEKGLCHGDFRDVNILVREKRICVLDYEWAGKLGQAKYPLYMNHVHITWPEGATDGALIAKEHDIFWVEKFKDVLHED